MTYFLFSQYQRNELIQYKIFIGILLLTYSYNLLLLYPEKTIIYYLTFIISSFFVFSLEKKIFFTIFFVNIFYHTFFIIYLNVTKNISFLEKFGNENVFFDFLTFLIIQIIIVYLFYMLKKQEMKLKIKENIWREKSEELGKENYNILFSRKKTSELSYNLHQFINNLQKSNELFIEELYSIKENVNYQQNSNNDILSKLESTIFLNDKIIQYLENTEREFFEQEKSISKNKEKSLMIKKQTQEIKDTNLEMRTEIIELINAASSINSLVELIRGISNQINLLSLNASIEAKKTGDTGKGTSVVAKEIKHLQLDVLKTLEAISNQLNKIEEQSQKIKIKNNKVLNNIDDFNLLTNNNQNLINDIQKTLIKFRNENENTIKDFKNNNIDMENSHNLFIKKLKSNEKLEEKTEELIIQHNYQEKNIEEILNIISDLQFKLKKSSSNKKKEEEEQ